jgi:hypothetical protein
VFERTDGLPDRVAGMRPGPEVERVEDGHEEPRLLLHVGPGSDGFGDGACSDLTRGRRATHVHRGAVVTEHATIRTELGLLGSTLQSLGNEDHEQAAAWVAA